MSCSVLFPLYIYTKCCPSMSVLANRDFLHLLEQLLAYLARMYDDHDGGEKLETRASFPGSGFRKCSKETPVF